MEGWPSFESTRKLSLASTQIVGGAPICVTFSKLEHFDLISRNQGTKSTAAWVTAPCYSQNPDGKSAMQLVAWSVTHADTPCGPLNRLRPIKTKMR